MAEAMSAHAEYNKRPIGERMDITLEELYNEWSKARFPKLSDNTVGNYIASWNYLSVLKKEKVKNLKTLHIQAIIDDMVKAGLSHSSYSKVKTLAGIIFKHARADDIVDKNYAQMVKLLLRRNKKEGYIY
jgi:site-specific recombinase XerD